MTRRPVTAEGRAPLAVAFAFAVAAAGCAASKAPARSAGGAAPSAPAAESQPDGVAGADGTAPSVGHAYAPPPPPGPGSTPASPAGGAGGATSRAMALQSAASEVESSQRELDVAAGDCRNACRALASMDRAAGKVCALSQGDGDGRRCEDARTRVYSARDRVRSTCGECPGGPSVERSAPIPSLR